jgi:hypothetical protein
VKEEETEELGGRGRKERRVYLDCVTTRCRWYDFQDVSLDLSWIQRLLVENDQT